MMVEQLVYYFLYPAAKYPSSLQPINCSALFNQIFELAQVNSLFRFSFKSKAFGIIIKIEY